MFGDIKETRENVRPRRYIDQNDRYNQVLEEKIVYVRKDALESFKNTCKQYESEVGFLIMGRRRKDTGGSESYFIVQEIPFLRVGSEKQVEIAVEDKREAMIQYPHLDVLGFAHSHPGFGIFFSRGDENTAKGFGENSFHIVYDPESQEIGYALSDEIVKQEFLSLFGNIQQKEA